MTIHTTWVYAWGGDAPTHGVAAASAAAAGAEGEAVERAVEGAGDDGETDGLGLAVQPARASPTAAALTAVRRPRITGGYGRRGELPAKPDRASGWLA
jgi:hypothetical protein